MKNTYSAGYLPIFYKRIIPDHNGEGFDSVDSEDFEPGFGCVPVEQQQLPTLPPPMIQPPLTIEEKLRRDYYYMTDEENQFRQDEFLKRHGII